MQPILSGSGGGGIYGGSGGGVIYIETIKNTIIDGSINVNGMNPFF